MILGLCLTFARRQRPLLGRRPGEEQPFRSHERSRAHQTTRSVRSYTPPALIAGERSINKGRMVELRVNRVAEMLTKMRELPKCMESASQHLARGGQSFEPRVLVSSGPRLTRWFYQSYQHATNNAVNNRAEHSFHVTTINLFALPCCSRTVNNSSV